MDLFGTSTQLLGNPTIERPPVIDGLVYYPDFISANEHRAILRFIDGQAWLGDLKRRVQHYGYKYDYTARNIDYSMYLGPIPDELLAIGERIHDYGHFGKAPDQAIINEYEPGQGIAPHIDCQPCFGDTIVTLSLLSPIIMTLFPEWDKDEKRTYVLEPRSLLIISGEARYKWYHGIMPRKSDVIRGIKRPRSRRISVTYREVILR